MSDIDLSAAIRAGIAAGDKVNPRLYPASDVAVAVSREAVLAAAPLIEAAVREQAALTLVAKADALGGPMVDDDETVTAFTLRRIKAETLRSAAALVRGEQP